MHFDHWDHFIFYAILDQRVELTQHSGCTIAIGRFAKQFSHNWNLSSQFPENKFFHRCLVRQIHSFCLLPSIGRLLRMDRSDRDQQL